MIATIISLFIFLCALTLPQTLALNSTAKLDDSLIYIWPLPSEISSGNDTLSVDPDLSLAFTGNGGNSDILRLAFDRYKKIIFKHRPSVSRMKLRGAPVYDVSKLTIIVRSDSEEVISGLAEIE